MNKGSISFLVAFAHDRIVKLSQRFGREAGLVLIARVLQNFNGFLLSVLIVRRFGLAAVGTMTVSTIAIVIIALLGTFGFTYIFARMDAPIRVKNALGYTAALAVIPLSLPFIILLGVLTGKDAEEVGVIAIMSLGGAFFAQGNLAGALQILQGKASDAIIPPLANTLGLVVAAIFGSSYLLFALLLAFFRFSGIFLTFQRLERAPLDLGLFVKYVRDGVHFLAGDMINLGSDQLTIFITSFLLSRADLGLFGLCRQMLTASDTPGWTQIQTKYPAVVADPQKAMPELRRLMVRLGGLCGVGGVFISVLFGLFVFHLPRFVVLAPLLLASVPLRYLLLSYDLHLRAIHALKEVNNISLMRAALALLIIPAGAWFYGDFGVVLGVIIHTVLAVLLTRRLSMSKEMSICNFAPSHG